MGLFDWFNKEVEVSKVHMLKRHLVESFSHLKNEMTHQNTWITYLHQELEKVKNHHDSHKENTHTHIKNVHSNMENIHKWINHLHTTTKQQEDKLNKMESQMKAAMDEHNKHIIELFKTVHSSELGKNMKHEIKNELLMEVNSHLLDHKNYVTSSVSKVEGQIEELKKADKSNELGKIHEKKHETIGKIAQVVPKTEIQPETNYGNLLTNPELKLLNMLFSEAEPVSYSHLSNKTGQSINTIRVNMNTLKKKSLVEENLLPNGVKLFNLKNKERIKKMYNVSVL